MSNPKITQLGTLSATGQGVPRVGVQGDHIFTATVSGAGAVSATVQVMGSNDLVGWVTLATLTLSGTALATASSAVTASHAYWRADVSALAAGATVQVLAASEEAGGGGSGLSASELAAFRGVVSEAGNLASADIATTTGTPGEVRRISDGDNRGALVVWATPQGATTPTWCWWLWPQAAY